MTVQSALPSVPSPAAQQPISWLQRWQAQGYFFRPVAFFTILIGVCLHLSRLLLGDAITFHTIVTPTFDQYFAFPIAYAGISGLFSWRRMAFRGRGHQFFLGFIVFYMVASIPIHLSAWFTHSIEHLKQFPLWFSVLLQPYYAAVLMTLWGLQFKVSIKSSTNSGALKGAQPMTPHLLTSTPSGLRNALLHQRVLRVHGVMLLMVSLAAAVNATVARYLGLGPYAFLQQNPMALAPPA